MLKKNLANFRCRLLMAIVLVSIMMTTNASAGPCAGQVASGRGAAQANFRASCGQDWNDQLRHQCTWVDNPTSGWICHEYAPNGLAAIVPEDTTTPDEAAPLRPPYPIHAQLKNGYTNVVWRKDAGVHGVNVYRNDQWIASVNYPGTVYNDYTGQAGDYYYLIAYDRNSNFSVRSSVFTTSSNTYTVAPSAIRIYTNRADGVRFAWNPLPAGTIVQMRIYNIDTNKIDHVSNYIRGRSVGLDHLSGNTRYRLDIRAIAQNGHGRPSIWVRIPFQTL